MTDTEILAAVITGVIGTAIGAVITTYQCCKLVLHVSVLVQLKQELHKILYMYMIHENSV